MGERVGSGEGEVGRARDRGRKIGTEIEKNKLMSKDGEKANRRGGRMRGERRRDGSRISQPTDLPPPCFHGNGTGEGSVL